LDAIAYSGSSRRLGLKARGKGTEPIKRETGLAKETVRRFHHMRSVDELLAKVKDGRPSILDEHKPYLHQRWSEGCANVIQLHTELKERGYKGSTAPSATTCSRCGRQGLRCPGPPKAREAYADRPDLRRRLVMFSWLNGRT